MMRRRTQPSRAFSPVAVLCGLAVLGLFSAGCGDKEEPKKAVPTKKVHLTVSGSATTTPILEILAKVYTASHPEVGFEFLPSSHTGGGVQGAHTGELALGATSRALLPEEARLGLVYREFARDSIVFAVNRSVPATKITRSQIVDMYSDKIRRWKQIDPGLPDTEIVVIDRPTHSSPRMTLDETLFGKGFPFSPKVVVIERALDANEAIVKTPNAIGYTSYGAVVMEKLALNILDVDGVYPSAENVASGKYPYVRPLGVVHRPDKAVKDFVSFIFGPEGRKIIADNGFVPLPEP
jgi:phosphate transport system substrate-binding protein